MHICKVWVFVHTFLLTNMTMTTRLIIYGILQVLIINSYGQQKPELTVEGIMQDSKISVGTSPSSIFWSEDSKHIYFNWNPEAKVSDSLYRISAKEGSPEQVSFAVQQDLPQDGTYNTSFSEKVFSQNGDIFLYIVKTGTTRPVTQTLAEESDPVFSVDDQWIRYTAEENLYAWNKASGLTEQLTDFRHEEKEEEPDKSSQDAWLNEQQLGLIEVLRERKEDKDAKEAYKEYSKPKRPEPIYIGDKRRVVGLQSSSNGQYITYALLTPAEEENTIVPNYVTESGYTEDIDARSKVGSPADVLTAWVFDTQKDTTYQIATSKLPGLADATDYAPTDTVAQDTTTETTTRDIFSHPPIWSQDGRQAIITFKSADNKDRWIALLDLATGAVTSLDRQRDEAWIAGPGIGYSVTSGDIGWMPDNKNIWFQSEATGYSHLYLLNTQTKEKKALTKGSFEVYNPQLSRDKKWWYFEANQQDPGILQIYKMPAQGGEMAQLTSHEGGYQSVALSPDEKKIAFLFATATQPWELYVMDNQAKAKPQQLTRSTTDTFEAYPWRTPEYITFQATDSATVHARLYRPENPTKQGPAVIFVHGAGYLQNAHHWWSSYFREYMFHNLLADKGYTVLDIDYRGSAGYGRDWRTGIYRYMGGKDLSDQIDGASLLADSLDIDPDRIGIYGGSYGGFITLMAMFTQPDVFAAGAALRSVTDWAHYNQGYTSNILNTPVADSTAFIKSSPIYYAEGLKGALLICHGMVDTNVHFQDVVRLTQRLIELKKKNWELAVYPVEEHGFVEPTSWMDEYGRILKLFEEHLK